VRLQRRLVTGAVSNCIGKLVAVASWFFLTPFVLARLGVDGYALWVLVAAFAQYGTLLDLGIGGAVIKYVAEHNARRDRETARSVVASAVWLYLGLAALAIVVSLAAAPWLPSVLGVDPVRQRTAAWLIALTGVHVAVAICLIPPSAVLRGLQRYDLHNTMVVVNSIVEAAAVAVAVAAGLGVVGMLLAMIAVNILTVGATLALVARVAPDLRIGLRGASMPSFRRIASFSTSLFAIQVGGRMYNRADEFVIAAAYALSGVTPYALARKVAELCEMAAVQMLAVVMPVASELDAGDDRATIRKLYVAASRVALATIVPVATVVMVLGGDILRLWVGADYVQYAPLVLVLAIASVLMTSQRPAVEMLQGMAQHRVIAITSVVAGIANIALSIVLVRWFGLMGVALGTLVPTVVMTLAVVAPFASRRFGVPMRAWLSQVWMPAVLPALPAGALLWSLARTFPAPSLVALAAWVAAATVVYGAGYLGMPAARMERRLLSEGVIWKIFSYRAAPIAGKRPV